MEVKSTVCVDCGNNKARAEYTGSLLCNSCQNKQFEKIRKIINPKELEIKMNPTEKVRKLLSETDLSLKEISEKTGRAYQTVWTHSQELRPKKQISVKTIKSEETVTKKEYDRLKYEYEQKLGELDDEIKQLKASLSYEKQALINQEQSSGTEIERLRKENEELSLQLKQPVDDSSEREYLIEKAKHDALFKYLTLMGGN